MALSRSVAGAAVVGVFFPSWSWVWVHTAVQRLRWQGCVCRSDSGHTPAGADNINDMVCLAVLYRCGLQVLVCTATLAWGVNLPAHTVIIKGTQVGGARAAPVSRCLVCNDLCWCWPQPILVPCAPEYFAVAITPPSWKHALLLRRPPLQPHPPAQIYDVAG